MISRVTLALWGPAIAVAAIGMVLGLLHSPPGADMFWDKVLHAGSYFTFAILLVRATHGGFAPPRPGPTLQAFLIAMGHGVLIEIVQAFVPWREASVGDALADAVGALLGVALVALWYVPRRGRALS